LNEKIFKTRLKTKILPEVKGFEGREGKEMKSQTRLNGGVLKSH